MGINIGYCCAVLICANPERGPPFSISFRSGVCHPDTQTDEFKVAVLVGSVTTNIPERTSRIESDPLTGQIAVTECKERGEYLTCGSLTAIVQHIHAESIKD